MYYEDESAVVDHGLGHGDGLGAGAETEICTSRRKIGLGSARRRRSFGTGASLVKATNSTDADGLRTRRAS